MIERRMLTHFSPRYFQVEEYLQVQEYLKQEYFQVQEYLKQEYLQIQEYLKLPDDRTKDVDSFLKTLPTSGYFPITHQCTLPASAP